MRILCYGDSNTWGYKPFDGTRFPEGVRWTSLVQAQFPEHTILEAGLSGRTTNVDDPIELERNGITSLADTLNAAKPLDLVILSLGTNDCKKRLNRTPDDIAAGLEALIHIISAEQMPILILIPAVVHDFQPDDFFGQHEKSAALIPRYYALARRYKCLIQDINSVASTTDTDGVHLDEAGHASVAQMVITRLHHWSAAERKI